MNKYKTHLNNVEILKELECLGMHIVEPEPEKRTRRLKIGLVMSVNGEPCELMKFHERSEISELWEVRYLNDTINTFVYI